MHLISLTTHAGMINKNRQDNLVLTVKIDALRDETVYSIKPERSKEFSKYEQVTLPTPKGEGF